MEATIRRRAESYAFDIDRGAEMEFDIMIHSSSGNVLARGTRSRYRYTGLDMERQRSPKYEVKGE
jgi:hypothetical protein